MRKNKAVSSLRKQIKKLDNKENMNEFWCIETRTYINSYFGENSEQFDQIKDFHWNDKNINDTTKGIIYKYLESCIETIIVLGIKKEHYENWFSKLPNWGINLGLPAICFISFGLGILFTNNNNTELKNENKTLKERLSSISTDSISNQHKYLSDTIKK